MNPVGQSNNFRDLIIPTSRYSVNEYIITGVYFLYQGAVLQYIGQSVNVLARAGSHIAEGKEFDSFTFIRCERDDLDALEIACIKMFRPALNVANAALPPGMKRVGQFGRLRELVVSEPEKAHSVARTNSQRALISITEVAERLGLSNPTVKKMMADGRLKLSPVDIGSGKYPRYKRGDVEEAIATMKYANDQVHS